MVRLKSGKYAALLATLALCGGAALTAQSSNPAPPRPTTQATAPPVPATKVDLVKGDPIAGLPTGVIAGYPPYCSSSGVTYFQFYDPSKESADFIAGDLYSIATDGTVTKIERQFPQNVRQMIVRSTYAGATQIATLISTLPKRDPFNDQFSKTHKFYISLSSSDGDSFKLIPLDLKFEPIKLAIFDSGKFIVLGQETVNHVPVLALLDTDGTFLRYIDLDSRPFAASGSLRAIYKNKQRTSETSDPTMIAVQNSQFVPYAGNILFFQPGSDLEIAVLSESGIVNSVRIKLPQDELLQYILPDGQKRRWIVRTQPLSTFTQFQKSGIVTNPPQRLLEVDPESGDVTSAIDVIGIHPAEVTCAHDEELISPHPSYSDSDPKAPPTWVLAKKSY